MINKFKRMNYVQRLSLAFLLLVLLCRLGGLTWAWLSSRDSVTNVFGMHDYFLDIVLSEPNWNSVGCAQAHKMQPGMDIFKDPRVTDITEDDCFVRVKIIVADTNGDELADGDRKTAILKAINYCTDDKGTPKIDDDEFSYYPNLNPEFYYNKDDGWFYYIDSSTAKNTSPTCAILKSGATTSPIFTDVLIPAKKAEYAYFSDGFYITVVAEGVYTAGATEDNISVADIAKRFDAEEETEEETESTSESSEVSSGSENSSDTDSNKDENTDGATGENAGGTTGSGTESGEATGGSDNSDSSTNENSSTGAVIGGGTGSSGIESNISNENDSEPGNEDSIATIQSSAKKAGVMIAISNSSFGIDDDALFDGSADAIASGSAVGTEVK